MNALGCREDKGNRALRRAVGMHSRDRRGKDRGGFAGALAGRERLR